MSKSVALFALLLLTAGCAASVDPGGAPQTITPVALEPPPVYALLGSRQELELTSAQVSALDSIAQAVRAENAPLADSVRTLGRSARGQARVSIAIDSTTGPLLKRIRANNQRAVDRVQEVLTPEQEATTCRLFSPAREGPRGGQGRATPRGGDRRGTVADSLAAMPGGRVWSWCGAEVSTPPGEGVSVDPRTAA